MVAESAKWEKTAQNLAPYPPRQPLPAITHSPNQPEYHPETARKVQKPYRKPSGKPFKTSNNRPNLHMVGAYATPCLCDWRRGAPARGGPPPPATFLPKAGRNGAPPRPHETLAPTPCAEKTRYAAAIGGLSGRITGPQPRENRGCGSRLPQCCHKVACSVV